MTDPQRPDGTGPRWLLVDRLIIAYAAIVAVVALTRLDVSRGNWGVALGHLLMMALPWLVRRPGLGRVGRVLGEIYPIILLGPLYAALDVLQGPGTPAVYDSIVQGWEQAVFGGMPSEEWWRKYPYPIVSTLLHGAYWSYYLLVPTPVIWFLVRGERANARRVILFEMTTFLFCYLWFVFFPVAGPYYMFAKPTGIVVDNVMARLVYATLADGASYGAAFPSSHVAASTSAVIGAWLGHRRLGLFMAVPALLLAIGTVYCHVHYAIDAAAGLVTGIVIPMILLRWDHGRYVQMEG